MNDATSRPLSLVVRWVLPEADDSHAEAACHEIEAVSLPEAGLGHSSHGKASGRAQQHELADVLSGVTYEVHRLVTFIAGGLA